MVVPAMAQPEESCDCIYAPKAGQWQIDLVLGQGQFFNDYEGLFYLLPSSYGAPIGIANGENAYISGDIASDVYNIGSLNTNNLVNIVGLQGRYFISNRFDINFMGAYNVNMQPSKDFIEGERYGLTSITEQIIEANHEDAYVCVGDVFAHKAVLGSVVNSLMAQIGSNYYFNVKNSRINPYIGIFGQFKYARVRATYPAYTGETVGDAAGSVTTTDVTTNQDGSVTTTTTTTTVGTSHTDDISTFRSFGRAGQIIGIGGGIDFGVSYSLAPGLILSFEVAPVAYQYTLMHLQIDGQQAYYTNNHNISAFKYPQVKLGMRF